jgi:hypothetical protein
MMIELTATSGFIAWVAWLAWRCMRRREDTRPRRGEAETLNMLRQDVAYPAAAASARLAEKALRGLRLKREAIGAAADAALDG